MELYPGRAISHRKDSGLLKVNITPLFWGESLIDGLLDGEPDEGTDPPSVRREGLDFFQLIRSQDTPLDALSGWREILQIHP